MPIIAVVLMAALTVFRPAWRFDVDARDAASAEVRLCGKTSLLRRSGTRFIGSQHDDCEGEGTIAVRYAHRPTAICKVGYVTVGMSWTYRYAIINGRCEELRDGPPR